MDEFDYQDDNSAKIDILGNINNANGQVNIAGGHIIQVGNNSTVVFTQTEKAKNGLIALSELIRYSSALQNAVISFRSDLKVVYEQVDEIADYKDLHDLLHRLQVECASCINQTISRFPHDQLTIDELLNYSLSFEEIVLGLEKYTNKPSVSRHEVGWIKDIGTAKENLINAIDNRDEKKLKTVAFHLNHVLGTQPARINLLLNHSARNFRLPALINALSIVYHSVKSSDFDLEKVVAFQSGVEALTNLERGLNLLIDDHHMWQLLDIELHLVETSIGNDAIEFHMLWTNIQLKFDLLYANYPDEWAELLRKERMALDDAIISGNLAKARRSFYNYHRRVDIRFFQIDRQLKALCDELRKVGISINSVLGAI